MIHRKTYVALKKAGWYRNRKLDLEWLTSDENEMIFPEAIKFLEEFGDLTIMSEDGKNEESTISLDYAKKYINQKERYKSCEELAGEKLFPVGFASNGHDTIFISESSKMYVYTGLIGNTPMEGWSYLVMSSQGGIFLSWGSIETFKLSGEMIWITHSKFGRQGIEWLQEIAPSGYNPDILIKIIILSDDFVSYDHEILKFLDEYPEHTELVIEQVTKEGEKFIQRLKTEGEKALNEGKNDTQKNL